LAQFLFGCQLMRFPVPGEPSQNGSRPSKMFMEFALRKSPFLRVVPDEDCSTCS
jgi:hypothetical protein